MIKKILLIFGILILCLLLPFTCSYCTAKAEEINNISLTALTDGNIETNATTYYLLGGLPVQVDNDNSICISTQSLVLYNEQISNNDTGGIYETMLIVPIRTSNTSSSILSISLGQTGVYEDGTKVVVPLGFQSLDVSLHSGKADEIDNITSVNCQFQFWQIDSDITVSFNNFNEIMQNCDMIKRFNYVSKGDYYCAFQFFIDDKPVVQLYIKMPYDYDLINIKSYESWFYPQSTLDLTDYIQAEGNYEYNRGFEDGFNTREPFFTITTAVNEFLQIELFGGFTLGTLFGIVIAISMLMIGLHLFRG